MINLIETQITSGTVFPHIQTSKRNEDYTHYYQHSFCRKFIFTSRQGELAKFFNRTAVEITGFGPKGAE